MNKTFRQFLFLLTGAFVLLFDATWNGYPIVYSDTSTYLSSGFEFEAPFDRPITYGIFLRLSSGNGISLWLVIFFQALMLSGLIFQLTKLLFGEKSFLKYGMIIVLFLSLLTGVSWTASQLMPDIFTSIALLSATLLLLGNFSRSKNIFLSVLFLVSVAMHISHILLFGIFIILLFAAGKYILPKQRYPNRDKHLLLLLLLTAASFATMGGAVSKSKHVFFMGAMVEHGIAKKFLDENCGNDHYKLCAYKDALPERAYEFVWDQNSPLYKMGGWSASKKEFSEIITATLTQPKYIGLHLKESIKATGQQLIRFRIGDGNGPFPDSTRLYKRIAAYFPNELHAYATSKQNKEQLHAIESWNIVFTIIMLISLGIILASFFFFRVIFSGELKPLTSIILIGILLNAWDCGTFANAIDRLGCKMMWLIPLLAIVFVFKIISSRKKATTV